MPLTERGERNARRLGERLSEVRFDRIWTSPLQRARRTCELAGFGSAAETDLDLVEWNYGDYEGLRTAEIHAKNPDWKLFRDGCPGGESPQQVAARADRVLNRLRSAPGNLLLFSSGHFLRMLAARWIGIELASAGSLLLGTASLSALGYEHNRERPVISLWNESQYLQTSDDGKTPTNRLLSTEVVR